MAIINAASLSQSDVQTAVNSASIGDTVVLPSGSANWSAGITLTAPANVTVKGAGTSATGGGDQTIIVDDYTGGVLFDVDASAGGFRLTGITFANGTGTGAGSGKYNVKIVGGPVRIDHCHFDYSVATDYRIGMGAGAFGVMDHNLFDFKGGGSCIFITNGRLGSGDSAGNYEWSLPTNFGSADYLYIEDNIFSGSPTSETYDARVYDCYTAGKVVVRFNSLDKVNSGETHATGHAGDDRGARAIEIYGNSCTSGPFSNPNYPGFAFAGFYNGPMLVWGNTADQCFKNFFRLQVVRSNNVTYAQLATPTGWGYAGTEFNGTGSMWDGGTYLGTDTLKGYPCLDQPGRGQGDLLTGVFPSKGNSTIGTIAWPNQALEPIYVWNNVGTLVAGWGGLMYSDGSDGRVVANRDYYPQTSGIQTSPTSPFDGTSGCGWGTLANRPTTCTSGVGYWVTNQGSWNISASNPYGVQQNGANGVLYKAPAANTWTLYYEPYTYPHPLRNENGSGIISNAKLINIQKIANFNKIKWS